MTAKRQQQNDTPCDVQLRKSAAEDVAGGFFGWFKRGSDFELTADQRREVEGEPSEKPVREASAAVVLPWSLRVASAASWRVLITVAAVAATGWLAWQLNIILIPVLVAGLVAVILEPIVSAIEKHTPFGRTAGAAVALLAAVIVVGGMLTLAGTQIFAGMSDLISQAQKGFQAAIQWVSNGPLHLDKAQVGSWVGGLQKELGDLAAANYSRLAAGALSFTSSLGSIVTGLLMMLFTVFFFLKDGRQIWQFFLRMLPQKARNPINEAGIRGWVTLSSYAKAQVAVAAIDAVGIGLGAWLLGVPLALPLGILVFMGAFIPIVGAIATGAVAVLVALVDQGPVIAVAMFVVILVVQQIESNVLYPILMSQSVNLHPLATLFAVAAGGYVAGIVGAMFAVPIMAFFNTSIMYLRGYDKFLYLNFDQDRPGGPPGSLDKQIADSLAPDKKNLLLAFKTKQKQQGRSAA